MLRDILNISCRQYTNKIEPSMIFLPSNLNAEWALQDNICEHNKTIRGISCSRYLGMTHGGFVAHQSSLSTNYVMTKKNVTLKTLRSWCRKMVIVDLIHLRMSELSRPNNNWQRHFTPCHCEAVSSHVCAAQLISYNWMFLYSKQRYSYKMVTVLR